MVEIPLNKTLARGMTWKSSQVPSSKFRGQEEASGSELRSSWRWWFSFVDPRCCPVFPPLDVDVLESRETQLSLWRSFCCVSHKIRHSSSCLEPKGPSIEKLLPSFLSFQENSTTTEIIIHGVGSWNWPLPHLLTFCKTRGWPKLAVQSFFLEGKILCQNDNDFWECRYNPQWHKKFE